MTVEQPMHPGEGDEELSESSRNDPLRNGARGKPQRGRKAASPGRSKAGDLGKALRSVYDTTLREDVPDDFLDLLGKLN